MEMNFCRRCGAQLTQEDGGAFVCVNNHVLYANAAPCVGIFFITDDDQLALSVRGIEPFKGALDAFGGFVDLGESFEDAIIREVKEELGLTPDQYETPSFLCSSSGLYPYDGEERAILGTLFWSRLKPGAHPVAADDVAEIRYVALNDVRLSDIGTADSRAGLKKLQELFS